MATLQDVEIALKRLEEMPGWPACKQDGNDGLRMAMTTATDLAVKILREIEGRIKQTNIFDILALNGNDE